MSNKAIYFNVDSDDFASAICENPIFVEKISLIFSQILDEKLFYQNDTRDDECDISVASKITGYKESSIYGLVHHRAIPHFHRGRLLRFSIKELKEWKVRGKLVDEIEQEASTHVILGKRKSR